MGTTQEAAATDPRTALSDPAISDPVRNFELICRLLRPYAEGLKAIRREAQFCARSSRTAGFRAKR